MKRTKSNLAILYARVSTARQFAKDLSVPDQLQQMRDFCAANGYVVVAEYVEDGRTARNDQRPAFQAMMRHILEGEEKIGLLLVHSFSRAFRNLADLTRYLQELKSVGTRLNSVSQSVDDTPMGRFVILFNGLVDEMFSAGNSMNVKRTRRENARRGYFNGSKPPFGYQAKETKVVGQTGYRKVLAVDEIEAVIVREIFDLYEGIGCESPLGMKKIVEHLNAKCLCRGQQWRVQKVQKILSDPVYTGVYLFGGRAAHNGLADSDLEETK